MPTSKVMDTDIDHSETIPGDYVLLKRDELKRIQDLLLVVEILGIEGSQGLTTGLLVRLFEGKLDMTSSKVSRESGVDRGHYGKLRRSNDPLSNKVREKLKEVFGTGFLKGIELIHGRATD